MSNARTYKQNLSSNSLFHFVDRIEYLIGIIQNGFQARYCHELIPFGQIPFAFPMKCFCDIPLGMIKYHIDKYGKYGIGVSKYYAKKEGITPIIYVHPKSNTLNSYSRQFRDIEHLELEDSKEIMDSLIPYFKAYDGNVKTENGSKYERYYDEREWRFIPKDSDCIYLAGKSESEIKDLIKQRNLSLEKMQYRLPIHTHSNITYIIVETEDEKAVIIKEIRKKFKSQIIQDKLISKIISAYRISRDF